MTAEQLVVISKKDYIILMNFLEYSERENYPSKPLIPFLSDAWDAGENYRKHFGTIPNPHYPIKSTYIKETNFEL